MPTRRLCRQVFKPMPLNLYQKERAERALARVECNRMEEVWQSGIYDAHCHPTDIMASIDRIGSMSARCLTVMSTRPQDQDLVFKTAERYHVSCKDDVQIPEGRHKVVPAFGWHPWFSHQLYDDRRITGCPGIDKKAHYHEVLTSSPDDAFLASLSDPAPLSVFLSETEARLRKFPLALVGEIGLDRSFRIPYGPEAMTGDVSAKTGGDEGAYTPGSREGRKLTPYKVQMQHQKIILKAQLELAAKYKRPVSVHSVQAHGAVFELLSALWKGHERPSKSQIKAQRNDPVAIDNAQRQSHEANLDVTLPFPPRICMHSYSGPPDALHQFLERRVPATVYFSFSECINFSTPASKKAEEVIRQVPDDRILIESDLHCAGDKMDDLLAAILHRVCQIKSWTLLEGAQRLKRNWEQFVFG